VTVYLVGAGPGDPGLLTRRGAALLGRADVVLYDRLVDPRLLDLVPAAAVRIDVGKAPGAARAQDAVNELLVEHGRRAPTVVRLKGGDPFVFGRGGEEAAALIAAGIDVEVVPGVSAAFAVPAAAGVPVTHRGVASSVTVVSGHVGDPAAPGAVDWASLARAGGTLVIMMGMGTRHALAERLLAAGRPPDEPVLVVRWGTTPAQQAVRTTLGRLGAVALGAPSTIVVGPVAALDLRSGDRRPLAGRTVVVTRARDRATALVEALGAAGAAVVELAVIAVADAGDGGAALRAAARDVGRHRWVVFTSATAVERFLDALDDVRRLGGVLLGAVGPGTEAALAARGLHADVVPVDHSAEGLVAALAGHAPAPGAAAPSVLFPRAAEARAVLAPGLRALGFAVAEVEAYRTVVAGPAEGVTDAALDAARAADVVTFTSPSTVHAYLSLSGEPPRPARAACIGPVTAEAARAAGFAVEAVAAERSPAGLVAALEARWGRPGPA